MYCKAKKIFGAIPKFLKNYIFWEFTNLMLRWYLSPTPNFFSDLLWPYCGCSNCKTTCSFDFDISGSSLSLFFFQYQITTCSAIAPRPKYCSDGYCIWQRCHALFVLEGFSFSPLLSCNYSEAAELLLSTKYVFL